MNKSEQKLTIYKLVGSMALLSVLAVATYVFSILWRVSLAEHEVLGKSRMLPVFFNEPKFTEPATLKSFGAKTFTLRCDGITILVWDDKINGYQHTLGSALASYEIGDVMADKLFVANEWAEWLCDYGGISQRDINDRRRDLANNRLGRSIGLEARKQGLVGSEAEKFMRVKVLSVMEYDGKVITHPLDKRVASLSERELGCYFLPEKNEFDLARDIGRRVRKAKRRLIRRAGEVLAKFASKPYFGCA